MTVFSLSKDFVLFRGAFKNLHEPDLQKATRQILDGSRVRQTPTAAS